MALVIGETGLGAISRRLAGVTVTKDGPEILEVHCFHTVLTLFVTLLSHCSYTILALLFHFRYTRFRRVIGLTQMTLRSLRKTNSE
jgi:hypothetical protein